MSQAAAVALSTETMAVLSKTRKVPVIVLVDDDRTTRLIVGSLLSKEGYEVHGAGRLSDARRLVAELSPDILILDGLLPDGTGLDLVRELRRRGSSVKVLFLSSFFKDLRTFKSLTQDLGVEGVLHKPQPAKSVVTHVRALMPIPAHAAVRPTVAQQ